MRKRLVLAIALLLVLTLFLSFASQKSKGIKKVIVPFKNSKIKVDLNKQYALIIGINEYEKLEDLDNAVYDAWSLKEVLTDDYGYNINNVIELYDEDARYTPIVDKLTRILKDSPPDSSVLIYFSGHGHKEESSGETYWLPADLGQLSEKESISIYDEETLNILPRKISFSKIKGLMKHSKVKHILIIADSCYSGELAKIKFGPQVALPKSFTKFQSRKVLASGRKKVSDGMPGDHSPFAKYFLKMLKNNKDNFFTANDLINYTVNTMRYNPGDLDQEPVGGPIQGAGHELGEFLFFLKESGKSEKSYATYLYAGNRAFKYEKFKEAKGHYEKLLQKFPDDTYAKRRIKRCDEINAKGISQVSVKGKQSYKIKNHDEASFKPALAVVVFLTNSRYGIIKQHIIDEKVRRLYRFLSDYKNFYTGWVSYTRTGFRLNDFDDEYERQILISDLSSVDTTDVTLCNIVDYINQKFSNVNVLRGRKLKSDKLMIILDRTTVSSNSRFLSDDGYSEKKLNIKFIDIREVIESPINDLVNLIKKD